MDNLVDHLARPLPIPYNPWVSYLVEASAGSGKTWQLSRRFLALVIAGADPCSILTATFTNKAASEMRERILRDAMILREHGDTPGHEMYEFMETLRRLAPSQHLKVSLRTPKSVGDLILTKTQSLRISTLDALFLQWTQRFPLETTCIVGDLELKSPWNLLTGKGVQDLWSECWSDVLGMMADDRENREWIQALSRSAPQENLRRLESALRPLLRGETFLFYVAATFQQEGFRFFQEHLSDSLDPSTFLEEHQHLFREVLGFLKQQDKRDQALSLLSAGDWDGLFDHKILSRSTMQLHGNTFRTAAKEQYPAFVALNQTLTTFDQQIKKSRLNQISQLLQKLYFALTTTIQKRKINESFGTLPDAVMGVHRLVSTPEFEGARAMAWSGLRHLLLDEFQDTSRLQWSIFEKLSRHLLAGESRDVDATLSPSVFIVGDKKQSIYRFREADPEVMDFAKETLTPFGLKLTSLSHSFRSSRPILDFVNHLFHSQELISEFPDHRPAPALLHKNQALGTYGSISFFVPHPSSVQKTIQGDDESSAPEDAPIDSGSSPQAAALAAYIQSCIQGREGLTVFDHKQNRWRIPEPRDFAILYPKSTQAHHFEEELRNVKIPSLRAESRGFFNRQEIKDLSALVTWLTWPADAVALCSVLKSPIIGCSDQELQELIKDQPDQILKNLQLTNLEAYRILNALQELAKNATLSELTTTLLETYSIHERYAFSFGPEEGPLARANILKWVELTRNISASQSLGVHQWSKALEEHALEDVVGNASFDHQGVSLMTIHKSKGLEFPIVIVTDINADWHEEDTGWIKDTRPGSEGFWYVGTSKQERPFQDPEFQSLWNHSELHSREEKARLLYVAVTRASQHLVFIGKPEESEEGSFYSKLYEAFQISRETLHFQEHSTESSYQVYRCISKNPESLAFELRDRTMGASPNSSCVFSSFISPQSLRTKEVTILTPSSKILSTKTADDSMSEESSWVYAPVAAIPQGLERLFGTLIHKFMELQILGIPIKKDYILAFAKAHLKEDASMDVLSSLVELAELETSSLIKSSFWRELTQNAAQLIPECPMATLKENSMIYGVCDLVIDYKDQRSLILDFKTSPIVSESARSYCEHRGYFEQLRQYVDVYKKTKPPAWEVEGGIFLLRTGLLIKEEPAKLK